MANTCFISLINRTGSNPLTDVTIFYRKADGTKPQRLDWASIPIGEAGPEQEIAFDPVTIHCQWRLHFKNTQGLQYQNIGWKQCDLIPGVGEGKDSGSHQTWIVQDLGNGAIQWFLRLESSGCDTPIEQKNW